MATIEKNKSRSVIETRYKFMMPTKRKYNKGKYYYIKRMGGGVKPHYYAIVISTNKPNINNIVKITRL